MMLSKVVEYMIGRKKPEETAIPSRSAGKPADRSPAGWRNTIPIGGGFTMARKLNLTGYRWLRSHYADAADLSSRWPKNWTPRDFDYLFAALVLQRHPDVSDVTAIQAVQGALTRLRIHWGLFVRGGLGHDFQESAR